MINEKKLELELLDAALFCQCLREVMKPRGSYSLGTKLNRQEGQGGV